MSTASLEIAPADSVLTLIAQSFSISIPTSTSSTAQSTLTLPDSSTVTETNTIATYLSSTIFPKEKYEYTPVETALIDKWLSLTAPATLNEDILKELNGHLKDKTTLLGSKPSIADVVGYVRLKEVAKGWSSEQRTGGADGGWRYILRWLDWVQNTPTLNLKVAEGDMLAVDTEDVGTVVKGEEPVDEKKAKKGKGKEKEAPAEGVVDKARGAVQAVADKIVAVGTGAGVSEIALFRAVGTSAPVGAPAGGKKEKQKKEKAAKQPAAKKEEPTGPSPTQIDLRVGFIEKCVPHENADSLFVSTIQCGDPEPRTVCSGLNGLIPIEEMQKRYVVVVCNLKPVTMRGVKSAAMVLAASPRPQPGVEDDHKGPVELVAPPEGAQAGEKVFFEGYNGTPEAVLNPKKKIWEAVQPGFTTTDDLNVGFDISATNGAVGPADIGSTDVKRLVTASGGFCTVPSLKGAVVR